MTPAERILADARAEAERSGLTAEQVLAAWCVALARGQSVGFMRAGQPKPPVKERREAHEGTLLEGER